MFKKDQEVLVTKGEAEGNIGIIVDIDSSSVPYLVKFKNGKTLWKHGGHIAEVQLVQTKPTFQEGQEVWVAFKDGTNKYKAIVIATEEHFTCVHSWVGIPSMEKKEIVENERVFASDYDKVKKHPHAELMLQYAQDAMETAKPYERWEVRVGRITWVTLPCNPDWAGGQEYRRKLELPSETNK